MSGLELNLYLEDEEHTSRLAAALLETAPQKCAIGLSGPLGAGKTALVRAFLQLLSPAIRVPSPTFILEQIYDLPAGSHPRISHWDLYRLPQDAPPEELFDALSQPQLVFIEWPEKSGEVVMRLDLQVILDFLPEEPSRHSPLSRRCSLVTRAGTEEEKRLFGDLRERLVERKMRIVDAGVWK